MAIPAVHHRQRWRALRVIADPSSSHTGVWVLPEATVSLPVEGFDGVRASTDLNAVPCHCRGAPLKAMADNRLPEVLKTAESGGRDQYCRRRPFLQSVADPMKRAQFGKNGVQDSRA